MRRYDWQERFSEFVKERRNLPFAWGENDCSLFAADLVLEMTGVDLADWARGTYADAKGALRTIEARGGLHAIATEALGEPIRPMLSNVGDVVLMTNDGRELLAICNGLTAIGPGAEGMAVMHMQDALAAWKV